MINDLFSTTNPASVDARVAGVDEVGRGPLAGPVVAAAVILPSEFELPGLNDSKKLSAAKRLILDQQIKDCAVSWSIGEASVAEIDQVNILQATMLAMQRAVQGLSVQASSALIDGNRCPELSIPAQAIIKGDGTVACISAASIVAKVYRDLLMQEYDSLYPGYGFDKNAGYPTKSHRLALESIGVTPIHRTSFAPVARCLKTASGMSQNVKPS